jgi:hypothetical protein
LEFCAPERRLATAWSGVGASGTSDKVQAAVHRFADDECPSKDLLTEEHPQGTVTMSPSLPGTLR